MAHMIKAGMRHLLSGVAAVAMAGAAGLMSSASASADTITATTTCTNPYTGSMAGPSSFDVEIPSTAVVGDSVDVTVSFAFTNSSGFDLSDANSFTEAIATTGTAQNPVTVTAGSTGPVANGSTVNVTATGTWTPDQVGTATFTLSDFSFNVVALGITIPVSCSFDSTPPAVDSEVSAS
jgi:hypothetical protein